MLVFLQYIAVIIAGLAFGSFATAIAYRVPRDLPWINARSMCPHCKKTLSPSELIPVVSWCMTHGKCRGCGAPIGRSYLLTELGVMFACLLVYLTWGFTVPAFLLMLAVPFMAALVVIDFEAMILPNALVLAVGILGLLRLIAEGFIFHTITTGDALYGLLAGGFIYAAFAWLVGFLMAFLLKKDALGQGDIKFFFVAGLWLGLTWLGWFCLLSGLIGVLIGLLWKALKKGEIFPFGPALVFSLYLLLIIQQSLPLLGPLNYY